MGDMKGIEVKIILLLLCPDSAFTNPWLFCNWLLTSFVG
jgi:hypothetical protein